MAEPIVLDFSAMEESYKGPTYTPPPPAPANKPAGSSGKKPVEEFDEEEAIFVTNPELKPPGDEAARHEAIWEVLDDEFKAAKTPAEWAAVENKRMELYAKEFTVEEIVAQMARQDKVDEIIGSTSREDREQQWRKARADRELTELATLSSGDRADLNKKRSLENTHLPGEGPSGPSRPPFFQIEEKEEIEEDLTEPIGSPLWGAVKGVGGALHRLGQIAVPGGKKWGIPGKAKALEPENK